MCGMIPMFSRATARKAPSSALGTGSEKIENRKFRKKLARKAGPISDLTRF
jgi:hypothetical protein